MVRVLDSNVNLRTLDVIENHFPFPWFKAPGSDLETHREIDEVVADMDAAGVEKGMLSCSDSARWRRRVPPEKVGPVIEKYPDRFIAGAVGVDPYKGMTAVRELEGYVKRYGFKAAHFFPHWLECPPDNAMYYPFYTKCVDLDIPVFMQICPPGRTLKIQARPENVERVAVDFPDLRIVGLHLGVPWLEEYMMLLVKQPNLYMTTSYFPTKDWDPRFTNFVNTAGQDKIIYDFASPTAKGTMKEAIEGIMGHPLDDSVKNKVLRQNAIKVFKLDLPPD